MVNYEYREISAIIVPDSDESPHNHIVVDVNQDMVQPWEFIAKVELDDVDCWELLPKSSCRTSQTRKRDDNGRVLQTSLGTKEVFDEATARSKYYLQVRMRAFSEGMPEDVKPLEEFTDFIPVWTYVGYMGKDVENKEFCKMCNHYMNELHPAGWDVAMEFRVIDFDGNVIEQTATVYLRAELKPCA